MPWILIGFIPAIAWGALPLAVSKIGGKPANQIFGTAAGAFVAALVLWVVQRPSLSPMVFLLSAVSGAAWVVGQLGQYHAYGRIGVSHTMPISTGLQLVGTSLIGVLAFGEWAGVTAKIIGFVALAVVVVGIALTAVQSKNTKKKGVAGAPTAGKSTLPLLFFTNFGYLAYSAIPDLTSGSGTGIFMPQTLGMLAAALLYILFSRKAHIFKESSSWKNMIGGLLFAAGALAYILSAGRNGIATAFVLAQLSVVISTLGGIFLLRESKTKFQMTATVIGLALIVAGSAATASL